MAGTTVDVALFPIDTIKTRLQAPGGFFKAGGFHGIYRGLGAAAAGSAPGAALFFSTYETAKARLGEQQQLIADQHNIQVSDATVHMTAASLGEVAACLVRVPTEASCKVLMYVLWYVPVSLSLTLYFPPFFSPIGIHANTQTHAGS